VIGTGQSPEQACTTVSKQFPSVCGPRCNPLLCESTLLDEPDPSKLLWSDEFDVDGAPDTSKWAYDIGDGCDKGICGWGNNELQWYTRSNADVANGILRITARKESLGGKEYTSARMVTRGLQAFRYGRIRFRAKLAGCIALGTWPALWLLPEQWVYGGWPKSGEIDVMEAVGYEENKFHGSIHTESFNHGIGTQKGGTIIKPESDWHIFEIDWQLDRIRFAVNKEVYFEFAPDDINNPAQWPFNEDFHILLNIAVGGNWGGLQGVDTAAFEGDGQYMEIDWVRVYSM
jgi:beta-glucanase (GH16 family)